MQVMHRNGRGATSLLISLGRTSGELQHLVHATDDVFHGVQIAEGNFRGDPAVVAGVLQGTSDRRPIDFSAFAQAVVEPFVLGVFLDVNLEDPLPQLTDPFLRVAELDDIADVEVSADPGALELIDVTGKLDRTEQELVPDLFNGDLDPVRLGVGDQLADLLLRAFVGVAVADFLVDDRRDDQDGGAAISLAVDKFSADRRHSAGDDLGSGSDNGSASAASHSRRG